MDAEAAGLATTKKNAEEAANIVAAIKATTDANAQAIATLKAQIEKDAASSSTAKDQGAVLLETIKKAVTTVETVVKEENTGIAVISKGTSDTSAAVNGMQKLHEQMTSQAAQATTNAASIAKAESDAKVLYGSLKAVAQTAKDAQEKVIEYEKKIAEYEQKITELTTNYTLLDKKIEGLLPNATSAGLASAFRIQKVRFKEPQRNWLITFVVTIALLLVAGITGLPAGVSSLWLGSGNVTPESWDEILRHLTVRLPFIVPLVWLGIYAGRNYMLALRVEEEYAFKEAVSTAFEGYKREMAGISAVSDDTSPPLIILCENVLLALAQRPGRIYEGRHEDITPLSPVKGMFGTKKDESKVKPDAT